MILIHQKLGKQSVTFSYTWKKGTAYEKTFNLVKDVEILAKPVYRCTSGNGTKLIVGQDKDLSFTITRSYNDEETYDNFTGIKVDGSVLDPSFYTVARGSLKVRIDGSYIKTLSKGEHKIEVLFIDGSSDVTLSIVAKPSPSPSTPSYQIPLTGVE